MSVTESRSFEIMSLIGQGGFGKVYRGRIASNGFTREVAIKLVRADLATPELLERLRDEARTLLLLRDRAIVSAEPPVQLGDQWAIIMELVDGLSTSELLRSVGPFPPSIALEIVGEVARALDAAYHQPGPDGPLRLVHRDLKCSNLQITRAGEVKILDFGTAIAEFADRESNTQSMFIMGTPGYLAPERFTGVSGPESDIFALGVTLYVLVTGAHPTPSETAATVLSNSADNTGVDDVVALARRMMAHEAHERPTAREVNAATRRLSQAIDGISLTEWARQLPEREPVDDQLVGHRFVVTGVTRATQWQSVDLRLVSFGAIVLGAVAVAFLLSFAFGVWALSAALFWSPPEIAEVSPELTTAQADAAAPAAPPSAAKPVVIAPAAIEAAGAAEAAGTPEGGADAAGRSEPVLGPSPSDPAPSPDPAPSDRARTDSTRSDSTGPDPDRAGIDPASASSDAGRTDPSPTSSAPPLDLEGTASDPAPAPAPDAPAGTPDAPDPAPAPAPSMPDLDGTWEGSMRGLPLVLRLKSTGDQLTGKATIDLGTQIQTETITGTLSSDGTLSFQAGAFRFTGKASGARLSGSYRRGKKSMPWSAELR